MEQVFRKSFEKISIDRENQFKSTRNFRSNGVMEVYDHAHSANKLKTRAEVSFWFLDLFSAESEFEARNLEPRTYAP